MCSFKFEKDNKEIDFFNKHRQKKEKENKLKIPKTINFSEEEFRRLQNGFEKLSGINALTSYIKMLIFQSLDKNDGKI